MSEEIKEILEYLKNNNIEKPFGMATIDKKRLLNYITNLQKENEEDDIYKQRNEKAIEYIRENEREYGSLLDNEKIILNILQGENDD